MYACPICGGQNALHFSTCPHAKQGPRVSALRTSLPPATNPNALPYMHGDKYRTQAASAHQGESNEHRRQENAVD